MREAEVIDILLVEDDPVDRAAIERLVSRLQLPWRLRTAVTKAEATALLRVKAPDLAILDWYLPDGTGFELRKQVEGVPHIFITSGKDTSVVVDAMRGGASDFLLKDLDRDYVEFLPGAVERALELHRLREAERIRAAELENLVTVRTRELRESETKYRYLVEASHDLIWKCDPQGRFVYLNPAWERSHGYTLEEMLGKPYSDFLDPAHQQDEADGVLRALQTGTLAGGEAVHLSKDGGRIHLVYNAVPVKSPTGEVVGAQGTAYDVTAQRRAEAAARASEERFRATFEQAAVGIAHATLDGTFLRVNRHAAELVGIEPEALVGKHIRDLVPPEDLEEKLHHVAAAAAGELKSCSFETSLSSKGGDPLQVALNVAVALDRDGDPSYLIGVIEDISERKKVEGQVTRESTLNAALAEVARTLIRPDTTEKILSEIITEAARRLTGSKHGYVSAVDPITPENVGHAATEMMGDPSQVDGEEKMMPFPLGADGKDDALWRYALEGGEAFYTNDPGGRPGSKGIPDGMIPLENLLSVPATFGTRLIGQIAVANSPRGYDSEDLKAVVRLADLYSAALIQKEAEGEVIESRERLQALTGRLQEIREEERASIARELHDELGQALTAMGMDLRVLKESIGQGPEVLEARINGMKELTESTLDLTRALAARLRSPILDVLGLAEAVQWQLDEFHSLFGIRTRFENELGGAEAAGSSALAAFRILQEALTNVARHAKADTVTTRLAVNGDELELEVTDNGVGIVPSQVRSLESLGLIGMDERARAMGGRLEIGKGRAGGARVAAFIPLKGGGRDQDP